MESKRHIKNIQEALSCVQDFLEAKNYLSAKLWMDTVNLEVKELGQQIIKDDNDAFRARMGYDKESYTCWGCGKTISANAQKITNPLNHKEYVYLCLDCQKRNEE